MKDSDTEDFSQIDQEYLNQKSENIKKAFQKQDKNSDDVIDQNELIDFLDANSKSGKFERNIVMKIFSILDIDKNGKITINEFINAYMRFIKDIKSQIRDLESNYKYEDKNKARLELHVRNNLNEILNEEQLGPNSKFSIEIINIEYLNNKLTYDGILIRISFGDKVETSKVLYKSANELIWQQKFEL